MENMFIVMCVDDDPIILQMLDFQLRKNLVHPALTFEFFDNPETAVLALAEMSEHGLHPLVLITDYQMPEMTGAQLIREIKKAIPSMNCLMLSGHANAIQIDDLVQEDLLDAFITKPWEEDELMNALIPILESKNISINYSRGR